MNICTGCWLDGQRHCRAIANFSTAMYTAVIPSGRQSEVTEPNLNLELVRYDRLIK